MAKIKTGRKDRWGWPRINRRKIKKEEQEEGKEDPRGQPHSHTISHGVRVKVRYSEITKGKTSEAKGRWNNLR